MCQWPRKPCDAQVYYLHQDTQSCVSGQESHVTHKCVIYRKSQELLSRRFQPFVSLQPLNQFLSNSYILCSLYTLYTQPYILNLKEVGPLVCEMCVHENCLIFFTFFFFFAPFYKSNFEPTKNTLSVDRFLSNLAHL